MEDKKIYNDATVEEAIENLNNEGVTMRNDAVVFYSKYEEEVDTKPDQLIGIESEDSLIEEMNKLYLPVVAVGTDVKDIKVGDKFFMTQNLAMSAVSFTAGKLKYGYISARAINILKSK